MWNERGRGMRDDKETGDDTESPEYTESPDDRVMRWTAAAAAMRTR